VGTLEEIALRESISAQLQAAIQEILDQPLEETFPRATYRVQLSPSFGFRDLARRVPYLAELGISHLYLSPVLAARQGSTHGYDIVGHSWINPELGGMKGLEELARVAQQHGLGLLIDVVPNHMCITSSENQWWMDVLEHGPSSPYASFFDIDWAPVHPALQQKVLYPILAVPYGEALEAKKLGLSWQEGLFVLHYEDFRLPLEPSSTRLLLESARPEWRARLPEDDPDRLELESILATLASLPPYTATEPAAIEQRRREREVLRRRLQGLAARSSWVAELLDKTLKQWNGVPLQSQSFDPLDRLLQIQPYRLAFWRVATDEINYRRFFDVNDFAALNVQEPAVYEATHQLWWELTERGWIDGWRIDHLDGLFDPAGYLETLQGTRLLQLLVRNDPRWREELRPVSPRQLFQWARHGGLLDNGRPWRLPLYVVVEKILAPNESLPQTWPIHGTTGYDFLNLVQGLFVSRAGAKPLKQVYERFRGQEMSFRELAYQSKKLVMQSTMSSELHMLGHELDRLSELDRWSRDLTRNSLTAALEEVIACSSVYRTYIDEQGVSERDRRYIAAAVATARRRNPTLTASVLEFVHNSLLLQPPRPQSPLGVDRLLRFVRRFQQFTGPVMAKGLEDTAFYRYHHLASLNEVGGDPERFGTSVGQFHLENLQRVRRWPFTLLTTSTHDTKRSEDVRCRLHVLSEIPDRWRVTVFRWARWNRRHKQTVEAELLPSRNDEYLLYQTLVGSLPLPLPEAGDWSSYVERIDRFMLKAAREAKEHTSWTHPNDVYETALSHFVQRVLSRPSNERFLRSLEEFVRGIADLGAWNSLAQVVLKCTCPGIPDFYQGCEGWNFRLVDPDNRAPVDFDALEQRWQRLKEAESRQDRSSWVQELLEDPHEGSLKLFVTQRCLQARRKAPAAFTTGRYQPLEARGSKSEHVVAFLRSDGQQTFLIVVPRLVATLLPAAEARPVGAPIWGDTTLEGLEFAPRTRFTNWFTGEELRVEALETGPCLSVARVLATFPVALLEQT
jgi:(1->4)-alpha-D-glucan 1-alpha-D-glucosylmutase